MAGANEKSGKVRGVLTILIVDDDEDVRRKAMRALAGSDVRLASAADGAMALQQAALLQPDIVICDVDLPVIGGFDVLAALKAQANLAAVQVMMLTSHASRHSVRLGMSLGADDYLTKPFTDEELADAVDGLVRRLGRLEVIRGAARGEEQSLRDRFAAATDGGPAPAARAERETTAGGTRSGATESLGDAAVLYADIQEFTSIAEKLDSRDVARLLSEYFDRACDRVLSHGGRHLKLMGDGLLAVFVDEGAQDRNPCQRALLTAEAMSGASREVAAWVTSTFPDALLPPFRVAFGLHRGEVLLSQVDRGRPATPTPSGPAVDLAARLVQAGKSRGWGIVASEALLERAAGLAPLGGSQVLTLEGGARLRAHEIQPDGPLRTALSLHSPGPTESDASPMRDIARKHAGLAASAVKEALGQKLSALRLAENPDDVRGARLHGFRILRRLATGGMSTVYLTVSEASGDLVVLKILPLESVEGGLAARFVREFSLLSRISHPNVVRIFNQGFGEKFAYIAMEYFENGDLRARMTAPVAPREVIAVGIQVASALAATHAVGIVHRDLKPENLMVRADGQVVLADFGIAKLSEASSHAITQTGELLGSPSYMSPEQILGQPLTHRSDLYSLGVVLYELCAGSRPYEADTVMQLLVMHTKAPPPMLPPQSAALQPIIDRLMAKQPEARFADARQAEVALRLLANRH